MLAQTLAAVATLVSFAVHGNRVEFTLDRGSAELTWVSARTFRFRRTLEGPLPEIAWESPNAVEVKIDETPFGVRLRSKSIEVTILKRGLLVSVHGPDGAPLMSDLSEPRAEGEGIVWDRATQAGVRFYGLGRRTDLDYDRSGHTKDAEMPFLMSTAGYGERMMGSGGFRFDFTQADRYRIQGPRVDYFFYQGAHTKTQD